MDRHSSWYKQVQLLLRVLPFVAQEKQFALKGGTAINLFVRDFPRLSVDIDLVYLPDDERPLALQRIVQALDNIASRIVQALPATHITKSYQDKSDALRLVVMQAGATVQIELSPVLRGTVFPPQVRAVSASVEDEFGFAEIQVVALEDLYAGKLCAAFDRQHPRDFFDVMLLLENEGITEGIRQAFLVYLLSHARPMEEILAPQWKAGDAVFAAEFAGMTFRKTSPDELLNAAKTALSSLLADVTDAEKQFLCSFYQQAPAWQALPFTHAQYLPAVRWKQLNIEKMTATQRTESLKKLEAVLGWQ